MTEKPTPAKIEAAARELLDALDRMYGAATLSANVQLWRSELRSMLPKARDLRDMSRKAS